MGSVSVFPQGFKSKEGKMAPAVVPFSNIDFDTYLDQVRDGFWQDEVLQFRAGKIEKLKLKGITASGTFTYRSAKSIVQHSGFIAVDIDVKDNPDTSIDALKERFKSDPYIYSFHHSAGGFGVVCYIKITSEKHLESFLSLEKYFADNYEIIIDKSCKNIDRYRFVSYDPDLFINRKSKTWKNYLKKNNIQPVKTYVHSSLDMDYIFQQISDTGIDLTDSYHDWLKIGFAIASKYGSAGRDFFHLVSNNSIKYDQTKVDKQYDIIIKRSGSDKEVTINSLFWLCQQKGIEIKTPRTEQIERIGKMRRKTDSNLNPDQQKQSAIKYLKDIEGIEGNDVGEILDIVKNLPLKEINEKSDDLIADLKVFLDSHKLMFNEITRNYEIEGESMIDRDHNSLYIKALEQVDNRISDKLMRKLIESEHTKSYHPFVQFFDSHKHLRPSGNYKKLLECISYEQKYVSDQGEESLINNYLEYFLEKWLLGIISSMHGTYSLLVLVFTGGQGTGKTEFFRRLLPDELKHYYAESDLDSGKDDEILMTKKIIVMDDEYGGKSKQDAKKIKKISSKQTFTVRRPYGHVSEDLMRLAVLCGTSNEEEILNDPTGNRRIIPVNVTGFDLDKFDEISKVDLFMELFFKWRETGNQWMLTKSDIAVLKNSTKQHEQPSAENEIVLEYFSPAEKEGGNTVYLTNTMIKNIIEQQTQIKVNPYKLGLALKSLGFYKKSKKLSGVVNSYYLCELKRGLKIM